MKGLLIVLEGIDGCGKSTQVNHLSTWLPKSGLMPKGADLVITREPGGTELGENIRKLLLSNYEKYEPHQITELLLYAADRAQHISQVILPAIQKGNWVISDRFSSSTMAYQGFGRMINKKVISQLEAIACQGIQADITLLLDISVSESIKRRQGQMEDRIESEGELFLERVSNGFKSMAANKNWLIIPANERLNLVSRVIEDKLSKDINKLNMHNL